MICNFSGRTSPILLAFSIYTNGSKLFSYKKENNSDSMQCLNGIRAISTQWVVLGHTFAMYMMLAVRNTAVIVPVIRN